MKNIYFIGIGGIGMSALARYFLHEGWRVAGYDLTRTSLTRALEQEGAAIHYVDDVGEIPPWFRDPEHTLVVYTPAVPADHSELRWFLERGFVVEKRSEMLGHVTEGKFTMAIAGTHGKTTTTTLVAWLVRCLTGGGSAFLGGISKNFDSNLVLESHQAGYAREDCRVELRSPRNDGGEKQLSTLNSQLSIISVEADEFDRSFLRLNPDVALITSVDADHLDIYGSHAEVRRAFEQFVGRVKRAVILHRKVEIEVPAGIAVYRYSASDLPDDIELGIPGRINRENAAGAVMMIRIAAEIRGERVDEQKLRQALKNFRGVKRRFDLYVNTPRAVYVDDYAHHPEELRAAIGSLKEMFPGRRLTAIFQPHLYSRTRDFAAEFGEALSGADEVVLTPIYPAREEPIEGVDAELIGRFITVPWCVVAKEKLAEWLKNTPTDVVATFGAGNIENHCQEIAETIKRKI